MSEGSMSHFKINTRALVHEESGLLSSKPLCTWNLKFRPTSMKSIAPHPQLHGVIENSDACVEIYLNRLNVLGQTCDPWIIFHEVVGGGGGGSYQIRDRSFIEIEICGMRKITFNF